MKINVNVYYNEDIFLVVPEVKTPQGFWMAQVIPNMVLNDSSDEELGEKITSTFDYSINKIESKRVEFWKEVGIKSFSVFSKKFQMIDVCKEENEYVISVWKNDTKGYSPSDEFSDKIRISVDTENTQLGETIKKLLNRKNENFDERCSIITAHNTKINYCVSIDLEDIEDGHTDAYQIYVHSTYDKNYIGFMIDSGYDSFSSEDIQSKWKQFYGQLNAFKYQTIQNAEYDVKIIATTKELEIQSYLFKDGEGVLELIFEIDLISTPKEEQDKIRKQFLALVESVNVD